MFFLLSSFRFCQTLKNDGRGEMRFREAVNDFLLKKKIIRTESRTRLRKASMGKAEEQKIDVSQSERKKWLWQKSCPRLSGKVSAELTKGARNIRIVSYKTTVNTCLSFLNEVMASEPFFEEQSDAVKVSETLYPTNGSGKNPAKDTRFKYSDLCTQACPYRLALLGTSLRIRGKRTLRKKEIIVF